MRDAAKASLCHRSPYCELAKRHFANFGEGRPPPHVGGYGTAKPAGCTGSSSGDDLSSNWANLSGAIGATDTNTVASQRVDTDWPSRFYRIEAVNPP